MELEQPRRPREPRAWAQRRAAGVPIAALSLGAAVMFAGGLPDAKSQPSGQAVHPVTAATLNTGSGVPQACATCGVVEAIRVLEMRAEPRSGAEGQKAASTRPSYRVTIKMADGSYRTLAQPTPPVVGIGDRVRVADGIVIREK